MCIFFKLPGSGKLLDECLLAGVNVDRLAGSQAGAMLHVGWFARHHSHHMFC
jgi:hypothetical protein